MTKTLNPIIQVALPDGVVNAAEISLPVDRRYREAWHRAGSAVRIDMVAARDIQRDLLRRDRDERLKALDIAYLRAVEGGNNTDAVVALKQRLRDVTQDPRIEQAQSPDQLMRLTLDSLLA